VMTGKMLSTINPQWGNNACLGSTLRCKYASVHQRNPSPIVIPQHWQSGTQQGIQNIYARGQKGLDVYGRVIVITGGEACEELTCTQRRGRVMCMSTVRRACKIGLGGRRPAGIRQPLRQEGAKAIRCCAARGQRGIMQTETSKLVHSMTAKKRICTSSTSGGHVDAKHLRRY
jgi:hypothetical protein